MALDAIGVVVEDMGRALAFYRRLGLEFPQGAEAEDHVEAPLRGGLRLMFDTAELIRGIDPGWTAPTGSDRVTFAFGFGSPEQVDEKFRALVEAGEDGHKEPWDAFWGQRYALLRDPDGNGVALFAPLQQGE